MQPVKKAKAFIVDALQNVLTGLGVEGIDKVRSSQFVDHRLSWGELENAYAGDWLTGKVCDVPPFDMTREWRTFTGSMDAHKHQDYIEAEKRYQLRAKTQEALTLARIYGGSGIIMNVDDGQDPYEPLNMDAIKKDGLRWLIVSDSQYLRPINFEQDPFNPNYGFPNHYHLAPSSIPIHNTRIVRFDGIPLPLAARRRNSYWGKSVIERLYNALVNASATQDNVSALIFEAAVDVIKVPDLIDKVSSKEGAEALSKRFSIAKMQKSIHRLLLLDAEEEYETHHQTFAGLKEMMQEYLNIVAGAADIPITRLLGMSPGGLNATGDSDMRNYYDFIAGQQNTMLRSKLHILDEIIFRSTFGMAPHNDELDFRFNTLWQTTDSEKAQLQLVKAQRDQIYLDKFIIGDAVVAKELMLDDTYSLIDDDYVTSLELMPEEPDELDGFNIEEEPKDTDESIKGREPAKKDDGKEK